MTVDQAIKDKEEDNPRPYMTQFSHVTKLTLTDFSLVNTPHIHIKIGSSTDVEISGVSLNTTYDAQNTDGIGLSGVDGAHIHDIKIHNGDDSVHTTGTGTQNILVEHSEFHGGHGLSVCGGGGECDVQNVVFRNSKIIDQSIGARIKATSQTTGVVRNITWSGIEMWHTKHPIEINAAYHGASNSGGLKVTDIVFENIKAHDDMPDGLLQQGGGGSISEPGSLECADKTPCAISLRDVNIMTDKKWVCNKYVTLSDEHDVSPSLSSCDHS